MSGFHRFREDVQGLRALAVVPVVLYHANPALVPGGYVGVDVFFVISGYLITHILLRETAAGQFSVARFYVRRVKRLFPALYLVFASTLLGGLFLLPPQQLSDLARTGFGTIFFISNIVLATQTSYFADSADLNAFLHTWSLAVEEQFYILYPIALYLIARLQSGWLRPILLAAFIGSLLLCVLLMQAGNLTVAFYSAPTRSYELLIGCIVATGLPKPVSARVLDALSWCGLTLIVGGYAFLTPTSDFPGVAALLPCIGAALVLYAGEGRRSSAGRWLSLSPAVFVGGLSYSLYLWHWPVLVFLRWYSLNNASVVELIAAVIISFGLAILTRRFVEQPALRRSLSDHQVLACGGATMAIGSAACLALFSTAGLPSRFQPDDRAMLAAVKDSNPRRAQCHNGDGNEVSYQQSCVFGAERATSRVAVWGDSFGAELVVALGEQLRPSGGATIEITASTCPPSVDFSPTNRPRCAAHNAKTLQALSLDPRVKNVVLVADYLIYRSDDPNYEAAFLRGFATAAERLHAAGKRLTFIYPIPRQRFSVPLALALTPVDQRPAFGLQATDFEVQMGSVNRFLDDLAASLRAGTIKPADRLCVDGLCRTYLPRFGALYFDDKHLSLSGARFVLSREHFDRPD